ncbi:hypothetical protein ACFY0F_24375 [Streptomyces sp. NPDC001544]|uniref:hypothetical protein n=1 Tax=Streptomyces sp. NPDC001544 TaxID=3364584 RepID=UPI0036A7FA11
MRGVRGLAVGGVAGLAVVMGGGAAWAGDAGADVVYHGSAVMAGDQVEVRLTPRNNGPSAVVDASVRLRWSVPLAEVQQLPAGCVREEERAVVCRTGSLAVDGVGERIVLSVRLKERPPELTLEFETAWGGAAGDAGKAHDRQRVLVLATGDTYAF